MSWNDGVRGRQVLPLINQDAETIGVEAGPGTGKTFGLVRREEYPGTEADYMDEQRRLFYVSITRSKQTLVMSRAARIRRGDAQRLGLAVGNGGYWATLGMSPFLRDIMNLLPNAVPGDQWAGCV